jgi:NAD(P)-dependent dehydrogenase (short-subunit alcohol dehydrogenase family)
MEYRDRHVVVTGGTGALGSAVVSSLVRAGAICHVPYIMSAEAERFALREDPKVRLVEVADLSDETAVNTFYELSPSCGRPFISPAGLQWGRWWRSASQT